MNVDTRHMHPSPSRIILVNAAVRRGVGISVAGVNVKKTKHLTITLALLALALAHPIQARAEKPIMAGVAGPAVT